MNWCTKILLPLILCLLGTFAEAESNSVRFKFGLGPTHTTMEVSGDPSENIKFPEGVYEGKPLAGTFSNSGAVLLRSMISILPFPADPREFSIGLGLSNWATGAFGDDFQRAKGVPFSFYLWSLSLESSLGKKVAEGSFAEVALVYDHALSGKSHFVFKGLDVYGDKKDQSYDDLVKSGLRLTLMGRYFYEVLPTLSLGLEGGGYYGQFKFKSRSESCTYSGALLQWIILVGL